MSWHKSIMSLHNGTDRQVLTESARAFEAVTDTNPVEMYHEYGFRYTQLVQDSLYRRQLPPVSDDTVKLVRAGMIDTINVIEQAFVHADLKDASLEERESIARHPITIRSFSALAARDQDGKDVAIGAYRGGKPALRLSSDRTYIATDLQPHTGERVCPFAGEKPSLIFEKFVRWAGVYAVYADDPSYQRRNGII